MADWLVTSTSANPASRSRRKRLRHASNQTDLGRVVQVMHVLDQGAVPVQEDSGPRGHSQPPPASLHDPRRIDASLNQRFRRADVAVIAVPEPAPHSPDEAGQDVETQVKRPHRRDLAISLAASGW